MKETGNFVPSDFSQQEKTVILSRDEFLFDSGKFSKKNNPLAFQNMPSCMSWDIERDYISMNSHLDFSLIASVLRCLE